MLIGTMECQNGKYTRHYISNKLLMHQTMLFWHSTPIREMTTVYRFHELRSFLVMNKIQDYDPVVSIFNGLLNSY